MSCSCGGNTNLNALGCCCQCGELPAVREEGPPGPAGPAGGVPVFTVGTVTSGVPSVTLTQVSPLAYTIDFVLPSLPTTSANTWTSTQTFSVQAVFNGGLQSNGNVAITGTLGVTGQTTLGAVSATGALAVGGNTTLTTLSTSGNAGIGGSLSVTGNVVIGGTTTFSTTPNLNITALTVDENTRGYVVLDHNNVLKFVTNFGYTARQQTAGTSLVPVPAGGAETELCTPITITVPVLAPNQPTPRVDIEVTVEYDNGSTFDSIELRLWYGTIGNVSGPISSAFLLISGPSNQLVLRQCNRPLAVGANVFHLTGINGSISSDITTQKVTWRIRD